MKAPKRYLVATGMAAAAAGLTLDEILSDSDLVGRFFEAFGAAQLRPEIALLADPATMHHLRTQGGRQEIDLVFDVGRGRSMGIEFKAAAAVDASDAKPCSPSATTSGATSWPELSCMPGAICSRWETGSLRSRCAPCGLEVRHPA